MKILERSGAQCEILRPISFHWLFVKMLKHSSACACKTKDGSTQIASR